MRKIITQIRHLYIFTKSLCHNRLSKAMIKLLWKYRGANVFIKQCYIVDNGSDNDIQIGNNCRIFGCRFFFNGKGNIIKIGNNVTINAAKEQPTFLNACNGHKIQIEDDCLLSNSIEIHTTDYHCVTDMAGNRINYDSDILIGKHTWIGLRSLILKGSIIPSNSIIAAKSLVNKKFEKANCIIGGIPAKILRDNCKWK